MRNVIFFPRLFYWFSIRHLLQHRWRALTVLLGIALGAAVFTSVRLSIHASVNSFSNSMDLIAGRADGTIIQPGGRVPETLITQLLKHPAVQSASPVLTTYVKPERHDSPPFLLIGFDPLLDRSHRIWNVVEKRDEEQMWLELIKQPRSLIVSALLARENGWKQEGIASLEHSRQTAKFSVTGILAPEGLALVEGGRLAITDIATFQEFTGLYGKVDRIDLIFKPGFERKGYHQIRSVLPKGLILASPSETRESGQMMIHAYQLNLSVLSFVSLFVGMFLVYSLIALNAASRRKELAVLRSLGASPSMIFLLFLAEGGVLGIAGWLLAIPVSTLLVKYLLHGVSQTISTLFVRVQVDRVGIDEWELLLSFSVTVIISILASWQPAREAMRVPPQEALTMSQLGSQKGTLTGKLMIFGILLIVSVWPVSKIPAISGFPFSGYIATFILFVGFSLLSPWSLQQIGGSLAPLLRRLAGEPAYLAGRYVRDSGSRTTISVGALITAVALFTALVIMIHSFRSTLELWANQTICGDLFITAKLADTNLYRESLPAEVVRGLKELNVPADIFAFRRIYLRIKKIQYQFEAMDFKTFNRYGRFFWVKGDPDEVMPRLIRGEGCLVSEVFSQRTKLTVGDVYQDQIENVQLSVPILGVVRDYRPHGGAVFYDLYSLNARLNLSQWSGVRFFFHDREQDLAAAAIKLQKEIIEHFGPNLQIIIGKDLRLTILKIFDETFAVTSVLLIIALIVAALGIATTLTVQVLERSRQLNTIFAVGGSSLQIRAMIFWEATLMVVVGEITGLLCGFFLSYLLVYVINYQSFGWTFHYSVNWTYLVLSLPLIAVIAILASFPAMQIVFKEPPASLLRER